jgi:hypothetical protein
MEQANPTHQIDKLVSLPSSATSIKPRNPHQQTKLFPTQLEKPKNSFLPTLPNQQTLHTFFKSPNTDALGDMK